MRNKYRVIYATIPIISIVAGGLVGAESAKFIPAVPEWVGKDYRDLTPAADSRELICWDDRPIPKECFEGGYNFDACYRMDLTSEQLTEFKRFYDNRCRNWDWDEYWVEYKADIDAGRRR